MLAAQFSWCRPTHVASKPANLVSSSKHAPPCFQRSHSRPFVPSTQRSIVLTTYPRSLMPIGGRSNRKSTPENFRTKKSSIRRYISSNACNSGSTTLDTVLTNRWNRENGHLTSTRTEIARKAPSALNSLSGRLEPLIPTLPHNILSWYSCGPTVYDHAHLGHARNYVCLDIIQRILTDHFGYRILHVMGMTDVDDKIIKRSAERGISPVDLARFFEEDFFRDMRSLNVRPPSLCTRVTEHIPDIMSYITQIMDNGFGYRVADGSVYFDVKQLGSRYGKLKKGENDTTNDGDEEPHPLKRDRRDFALWKGTSPSDPSSASDTPTSTVHSADLSWSSPWSETGRPGWHIECSAMSGKYLGTQMDVHWGGIDLAFPHHNNEIAQADAFTSSSDKCLTQRDLTANDPKCLKHDHSEWVRYFLHSGHLHIEGKKMSKSLKNFVTIKEFLEGNQGTADELRLLCLNAGYHSNMDFTQARIHEARQQIERFKESLARIMKIQKNANFAPRLWGAPEHALFMKLEHAKERYDAALCDNFNTKEAIMILLDLVRSTNVHCDTLLDHPPCAFQLDNVAKFLVKSLTTFGLTFPGEYYAESFGSETSSLSHANRPLDDYTPLVSALVAFRNNMRSQLLKSLPTTTDKETLKILLNLTDELRDSVLPDLGIIVKDIPNEAPEVRIISKAEAHRLKNQETEANTETPSSPSLRADFTSKTVETLFLDPRKYSQYDELHIPTHDYEGQALSKSSRKKLQKEMDKFIKWSSNSSTKL